MWTLPGVVVTPSVRPAKFMRILTLKIDRRFEGGDGFSGMCKGARCESVSSTLSLRLECVSEFAMGLVICPVCRCCVVASGLEMYGL